MANNNTGMKEWFFNDLKILSLNVQGLRNNYKLKSVLRTLKQEKVDIVLLQETYLMEKDLPMIEKLWDGPIHFLTMSPLYYLNSIGCL